MMHFVGDNNSLYHGVCIIICDVTRKIFLVEFSWCNQNSTSGLFECYFRNKVISYFFSPGVEAEVDVDIDL
jgi:hypothetical protein